MAVTLTRVVTFRADHRFWVPEWSPERNREAFGALSDPPGHGHDYRAGVTVSGPLDDRGMIMDLAELDRIMREEITDALDGRHINLVLPGFAYGKTLPTCEALAAHYYRVIERRLPAGVRLARIRMAEDDTLYADCTGTT